MRIFGIFLLGFIFLFITVVRAFSEPTTQPGYEIWGDSQGIPEVWFTENTEEPDVLGEITHYNQKTPNRYTGDDVITLDTSEGTIVLKINRTANIDCMPVKPCPDTLEVYDLPIGFLAIPTSHTLDEGSFGYIQIIRYTGM